MQSPHSFIVQPQKGKRYDNTKKFGEVDFIVSSSQEDHKFSNRYGTVISLPSIVAITQVFVPSLAPYFAFVIIIVIAPKQIQYELFHLHKA